MTSTFETIAFLHICHRPNFIHVTEPRYFANPYLQSFFKIVHKFWLDYKILPFDITNPSTNQLRDYCERNINDVQVEKNLSKEENLERFVTNAGHIIRTDYKTYNSDYLDKSVKSWVQMKSFEIGAIEAIEYYKTSDISPENALNVILETKKRFLRNANFTIDDDDGSDFWDPNSHKQLDAFQYVTTNWKHLNNWLSGKPIGGFESGTLTIFTGAPNVGKSIWLGNIATNIAENGGNVLLISLEMAAFKIHRRLGSNLFQVPIGEYAEFAQNTDGVASKINHYRESRDGGGLTPVGALRVKRFTKATGLQIEAFARSLEDKLGLKWHAIVIDYLNELDNAYGVTSEKMYNYHKMNVNDLYCMAGDNNWSVITAFQLKLKEAGSADYTLDAAAESSGITHRPDNIIGIVQTPEMRVAGEYWLKYLKARESEFKDYKLKFKIDYRHMRLTETDIILDASQIPNIIR